MYIITLQSFCKSFLKQNKPWYMQLPFFRIQFIVDYCHITGFVAGGMGVRGMDFCQDQRRGLSLKMPELVYATSQIIYVDPVSCCFNPFHG